MNVRAECYDYVKVTDSRENDSVTGNIFYLNRHCSGDIFQMSFSFGEPEQGLGMISTMAQTTELSLESLYSMILAYQLDMRIMQDALRELYQKNELGIIIAGDIRLGTGTPGIDFTGIRIYKSGTTYRVASLKNDVVQTYIDGDGITIDGDVLRFRDTTLTLQGSIFGSVAYGLAIVPAIDVNLSLIPNGTGKIILFKDMLPDSAGSGILNIGSDTAFFNNVYADDFVNKTPLLRITEYLPMLDQIKIDSEGKVIGGKEFPCYQERVNKKTKETMPHTGISSNSFLELVLGCLTDLRDKIKALEKK